MDQQASRTSAESGRFQRKRGQALAHLTGAFVSLVGLLLISSMGEAASGAYKVRVAVLQGDPVPDLDDAFFDRFDVSPAINNAEKLAFTGDLQSSAEGIFAISGGETSTLALQGDPAPDTLLEYCFFDHAPSINASGVVAFPAVTGLSDGSACQAPTPGVFSVTPSEAAAVALAGETAPETGGADYCSFDRAVAINDTSDIALTARYGDCKLIGLPSGYFETGDSSDRAVVLTDDSAPTPEDGIFVELVEQLAINDSAAIAMVAGVLSDPGGTPVVERGVFVEKLGTLTSRAFPGDQTEGGQTFTSFEASGVSINDSDEVAFNAEADAAPGLFLSRLSETRALLVAGDSTPQDDGTVFQLFPEPPVINEGGDIAFVAGYAAAEDQQGELLSGVFAIIDGRVLPVALEGDSVPGVEGGVFTAFNLPPAINDAATLAFTAEIDADDPGIREGIFVAQLPEPASGLQHLAVAASLLIQRRRLRRD